MLFLRKQKHNYIHLLLTEKATRWWLFLLESAEIETVFCIVG